MSCIPPERSGSSTTRNRGLARYWFWPLIALFLIVFGIAIGFAINSFTQRISTSPPPSNNDLVADSDSQSTPEATADSENSDEPSEPSEDNSVNIDASAAQTVTTTSPTATPTVRATATPAPLRVCDRAVVAEFESLVAQRVLGCPTTDRFITWAAWQPFERGYLFWRSDRDSSYALIGRESGLWTELQLSGGDSTQLEPADRGNPPPGLEAPVRGFGYVWATDDGLFNAIGWATDKEKGFCVAMQGFENGLVLQSTPVDSCTPNGLFNQAQAPDWKPVTVVSTNDGRWSVNRQLPTSSVVSSGSTVSPTSAPNQTGTTSAEPGRLRPESHGRFSASATGNIILDGDLSEWGDARWIPIQAVVWGADERSGDADFSAQVQLRWSESDLWFALRVTDDAYRSGPFGTNMWQGDGVEIHFDRELAADYDSGEMDGDDYQIGVSFGPTLTEITAYRWIPFELEGSMPIAGAAQATDRGYNAEFRLPWSTFTVADDLLSSGQTFGFNISINDNDSNQPAQQTTISASPARTDHKTPTEWGTLVLE